MKFGKRLKQQIQDTLPDWRDKFLSYKELKKLVRSISSSAPELLMNGFNADRAEFVCLLNSEIEKFNSFFMEQEEDFVIRLRELGQRIERVMNKWGASRSQPNEMLDIVEMSRIREDIVNLHGEMVLLVNYSNVNYTGLAKILKKYDKRTGGLLRPAMMEKIVEQQFYRTELVSKMIRQCETTIDAVFPASAATAGDERLGKEGAVTVGGEGIFRNTVAALVSMQEIRRRSSTYSHFSLPPLNLPDSELIHSFQLSSPIPIPLV